MAMSWAQFTAQPNGTRIYNHYFDQCVALANQYHEEVTPILGAFVPVNSAFQWWTDYGRYTQLTSKYTQSGTPIAGAIVVMRGGIYDGTHGHIGVVTSVNGNGTFNTMEQNAGTWRYLGRYTRGMANVLGFLHPRQNPAGGALQPNQRQVGGNVVKRREGPSSTSRELPEPLQPGTIGNFDGWIYGEQVNDGIANTNVWYRGTSGNWFWAGGFTKISGEGLTNLNPVDPPKTNERTVGANPARRRTDAMTSAPEAGPVLPAGSKVLFDGWKNGQQVTDSVASTNVWYRHADGWWAWAGAFTQIASTGLQDLNPVDPVPPAPEPPTPPAREPVSATTPNWDAAAPSTNPVYPQPKPKPVGVTLPGTIVERVEAVSVNGYTQGRPDVKGPNHIVLHHTAGTSLEGAVSTLRGTTGAPTTNYVVQGSQLVGMVPEADSPWTNGRWTSNMYSVTFEMVNAGKTSSGEWSPPSAQTIETTAWAMARAAQRWNIELPLEHGVNVFGHREVSKSATACPGTLDVGAVVKRANDILVANPAPNPDEPTFDAAKVAAAVDVIAEKFVEISDILKGA